MDLSDPSLIERLGKSGDFLAAMVSKLLGGAAAADAQAELWDGAPIRLIDSSIFTGPGKKGVGHRLHAAYDPVLGRFTFFDLTALTDGENLTRADDEAGAIKVGDRNYARTWAMLELAENGDYFCVRAGASSARMLDPTTMTKVNSAVILAALGDQASVEIPVVLVKAKGRNRKLLPARLVILRASDGGQQRELARIERSKSKQQAVPRPETYALSKVMMLITNLPRNTWPIANVHKLYRLRWQIELAFKTLKSTFEMRRCPSKTANMARAWILANLAAALIAERLSTAVKGGASPSDG